MQILTMRHAGAECRQTSKHCTPCMGPPLWPLCCWKLSKTKLICRAEYVQFGGVAASVEHILSTLQLFHQMLCCI